MSPNPVKPSVTESIDKVLRELYYKRNIAGRVDCLKRHEALPYLKKVVLYAYDPYIRFGVNITKHVHAHLYSLAITSHTAPSLDFDDVEIWETLDDLRTSSASAASKVSDLELLFARLDRTTASLVLGILSKNLVRGVAASTINKAWPGHIPSFKVQLAAKYTDRKIKNFPAYVEPKYDGMRAIAIAHPTGEVEFMTRTGRPIPAAGLFMDEVLKIVTRYRDTLPTSATFEGLILDGELLGETFNDTVSMFRKDAEATSGKFMVFDMLPLAALTNPAFVSAPYTERRGLLERVMANPLKRCELSPSYLVNSRPEIWTLYDKSRELGYEGLIVKSANGLWRDKRSNDWLKIKAQETLDLTIIGGFEGQGELDGTLGGVIVDFEGEKVRVGSGFSRSDRDRLYVDFQRDLKELEEGGTDFELFGVTAEVQFQEITPAGSLRHPVFIRLRKDKDEAKF